MLLVAFGVCGANAGAAPRDEAHLKSSGIDLFLLANRRVRFDNGPELDIRHLRAAIARMSKMCPGPNVHLQRADRHHFGYSNISHVIEEFQRAGYDRLGYSIVVQGP
jgi:hypothetical protein